MDHHDIEDLPLGRVERWAISLLDVPGQLACVVYLRGCSIRCQDCHNCALQDPQGGGRLMTAAALAGQLNTKRLPSWVCFQGGEPLDQAAFVASVVQRLHPRFSVAVYTGNSTKAALRKHGDLLGLPRVRMLKAGPFLKGRRVEGRFLATTNQQLHLKAADGSWQVVDWLSMDLDELVGRVEEARPA